MINTILVLSHGVNSNILTPEIHIFASANNIKILFQRFNLGSETHTVLVG